MEKHNPIPATLSIAARMGSEMLDVTSVAVKPALV